MSEENQQQNNSFKVNLNGRELTGAEAREYVEQFLNNFPQNITGSFDSVRKMVPQMFSGASMPFKMSDNLWNNLGTMKENFPVLDISKDFGKMSMRMNGETLFDLDLQEIIRNSIQSSKKS